jgi:[acyl-carrier-protein] S-malonyltransferase
MLPVSAPFHCPDEAGCRGAQGANLAGVTLSAPLIPVMNNVGCRCNWIDPQVIKDALVRQAAAPVRWVETMQAMQAAG